MSRVRYILIRSVQTLFWIWAVITMLFFFFRLMPGDFTARMVYQGASESTIRAFEENWGLNEPLYIQYSRFMVNLVQFDAGSSLQYRQPVWEMVKMRIFNSFLLIGPAITFAYVFGSIIGLLMGYKKGTRFEKYSTLLLLAFGTIPIFFTGILLIIIFSVGLGWFPTGGMFSAGATRDVVWWVPYLSGDFILHYILPFSAIVLRYVYLPTLIMRNSVVETLDQAFIYYHRITGIPERSLLRHIGKHSILPVITMFPVSQTRAIGGLVLLEVVFNWPGIGFTLVQAVLARDFPVVQFVFFLVAAFIIVANFLIDILYGIIDPRISIED